MCVGNVMENYEHPVIWNQHSVCAASQHTKSKYTRIVEFIDAEVLLKKFLLSGIGTSAGYIYRLTGGHLPIVPWSIC